ncbi:hypothetical protein AYI69_g8078 [Smittium culicis]|uniref:Uncharacterized protein n=1 Tax=Smittium culicis TaxID=133412 RepID=A0A1R1XMC7_9FUNG|nr:hypothetical protein AYI69_g8078 [Smittium culicis]
MSIEENKPDNLTSSGIQLDKLQHAFSKTESRFRESKIEQVNICNNDQREKKVRIVVPDEVRFNWLGIFNQNDHSDSSGTNSQKEFNSSDPNHHSIEATSTSTDNETTTPLHLTPIDTDVYSESNIELSSEILDNIISTFKPDLNADNSSNSNIDSLKGSEIDLNLSCDPKPNSKKESLLTPISNSISDPIAESKQGNDMSFSSSSYSHPEINFCPSFEISKTLENTNILDTNRSNDSSQDGSGFKVSFSKTDESFFKLSDISSSSTNVISTKNLDHSSKSTIISSDSKLKIISSNTPLNSISTSNPNAQVPSSLEESKSHKNISSNSLAEPNFELFDFKDKCINLELIYPSQANRSTTSIPGYSNNLTIQRKPKSTFPLPMTNRFFSNSGFLDNIQPSTTTKKSRTNSIVRSLSRRLLNLGKKSSSKD